MTIFRRLHGHSSSSTPINLFSHTHPKKKRLYIAVVVFILAYSGIFLFSSTLWTHERKGDSKNTVGLSAISSRKNIVSSSVHSTDFIDNSHSLSNSQSSSQSNSQSAFQSMITTDTYTYPSPPPECDFYQAWKRTNGIGLYAGREYNPGDIIDVAPTVPIHLNRYVVYVVGSITRRRLVLV